MTRKMKLSGYFVSPTMLQSVAWLSLSDFDGSLKIEIENCNIYHVNRPLPLP